MTAMNVDIFTPLWNIWNLLQTETLMTQMKAPTVWQISMWNWLSPATAGVLHMHSQGSEGRWISVINGNCCVISGFVIANVRCWQYELMLGPEQTGHTSAISNCSEPWIMER